MDGAPDFGVIMKERKSRSFAPLTPTSLGAQAAPLRMTRSSQCARSCFPTHDAMKLRHGWGTRFRGDYEGKKKQILRSAYPNFVGGPSCSAQDDTFESVREIVLSHP